MTDCACTEIDGFWKLVDEVRAGALVRSAIAAAKSQVEYSRAHNASKRSEVLLGKNAGREHEYRAELHFHKRLAQLRDVKQSFAEFVGSLDKNQKKKISDSLRAGRLKELADNARRIAVLSLLDADLSPEDAQKALKSLNSTLETIEGLTTFDKLTGYLNRHLDELIGKQIGNPSASQGLCLLILVITSLYAVLIIIAVLICALTLGFGCEGVLQRLLDQACPP
jgi:hypothetical protein